jgi:hypothetical protein
MRTHCVICDTILTEKIFTFKDYPICASPTEDPTKDEFTDNVFIGCKGCGCVQLESPICAKKLYENSHNSTQHSALWMEHHEQFSQFIMSETEETCFTEIGGNSGVLYSHIAPLRKTEYTIFDICDSPKRPTEVNFVQGNCEEQAFTQKGALIMSHTFEHLYEPRKFLQQQNLPIFLSIPNMDILYERHNIGVLHTEHTYFIGYTEAISLFSEFGYRCRTFRRFKDHSYFFYFEKGVSIEPYVPNDARLTVMRYIFEGGEAALSSIVIDSPCFICPAGLYGQRIYHYLKRYKQYINGFIDNDPLKQGKSLYGTGIKVYPSSVLSAYTAAKISVVLYAGPYTKEIQANLDRIHPNIHYITL